MVERTKEHNLGLLILELARKQVVVKVGVESNILGKESIVLHASMIAKGKPVALRQVISDNELEDITDAYVIADATYERLKRQ